MISILDIAGPFDKNEYQEYLDSIAMVSHLKALDINHSARPFDPDDLSDGDMNNFFEVMDECGIDIPRDLDAWNPTQYEIFVDYLDTYGYNLWVDIRVSARNQKTVTAFNLIAPPWLIEMGQIMHRMENK